MLVFIVKDGVFFKFFLIFVFELFLFIGEKICFFVLLVFFINGILLGFLVDLLVFGIGVFKDLKKRKVVSMLCVFFMDF